MIVRPRRSALYMPASNTRAIEKARAGGGQKRSTREYMARRGECEQKQRLACQKPGVNGVSSWGVSEFEHAPPPRDGAAGPRCRRRRRRVSSRYIIFFFTRTSSSSSSSAKAVDAPLTFIVFSAAGRRTPECTRRRNADIRLTIAY